MARASGPFKDGASFDGPAALSEVLFAGELVVYRILPAMADLVETMRSIVIDTFGAEPDRAEQHLAPDTFRKLAGQARKQVANDADALAQWYATLKQIGYALDTVRSDRMRLRIAPSSAAARSRFARPLPVHRDSWGSGISCQINWWAPLFPLAETRTMLIWPDGFDTPIKNTSADWDYDKLLSGTVPDYPLLPEATATPPGDPVPVLIEPGEILAFSAAHLHASVTDTSGCTRFSLDTRSIWEEDIAAGRGAPDVDGGGRPPRWDMFERAPVSR